MFRFKCSCKVTGTVVLTEEEAERAWLFHISMCLDRMKPSDHSLTIVPANYHTPTKEEKEAVRD